MKKHAVWILGLVLAIETAVLGCAAAGFFSANHKSEQCIAQLEGIGTVNERLEAENASLMELNSSLSAENESLAVSCSEASEQILSDEEYIEEINERLLEIEEEYTDSDRKADYESEYPDMYASEQLARENSGKIAYLTFDDGPSELTPQVLDVLDEYGIKATFFVTYKDKEDLRKYYKEIVERGHTIAVHTASHEYEDIYKSVDAYLEDFYKMYDCIYEQTGVRCSLFRFPGGSHNGYKYGDDMPLIIAEMERRGFKYYDWNVSTGDGGNWVTPADILNRVKEQSEGRSRLVVLMHDSASKTATLEALPQVIEQLKADGYEFARLTSETEPVQFARWN